MIEVIRFILNCVIEMARMLFSIQLGGNMSLGLLMCIIFIFLPMLLRIVYFLRGDVVEEINQHYEESRPRETFSSTQHDYYDPKKRKHFRSYSQDETVFATNIVRRGRGGKARRSVLR